MNDHIPNDFLIGFTTRLEGQQINVNKIKNRYINVSDENLNEQIKFNIPLILPMILCRYIWIY